MTKVFSLLLVRKHGPDERSFVRACDNEGNTALHLAVQNGQIEVSRANAVRPRLSEQLGAH